MTVSLCEFNSFLIKHNLRLDKFEEKMEAALENLQESVQETRSMVKVHYKQSVNWHRSWMETALSNSNKLIDLENLYDEMVEYLVKKSIAPIVTTWRTTCSTALGIVIILVSVAWRLVLVLHLPRLLFGLVPHPWYLKTSFSLLLHRWSLEYWEILQGLKTLLP